MNVGSGLDVPELLIDTDIFVDHLRGARTLALARPASYSVITRAELFAGRPDDELLVQAVLLPHSEIVVDGAIAERAGRLRRDTRLATPDALIAATALEHGLLLVTRNRRDFGRIAGLRLHHLNP